MHLHSLALRLILHVLHELLVDPHLVLHQVWLTMVAHLLMHHKPRGLTLLVLHMLLLELPFLRPELLVETWIIKVFVPFFDCKKYFAALVAELAPLLAETIVIIHVFLRLLGVLDLLVIYEGVGSVFCVGLCLLHPDGPDSAVS